MILVLKAIDRVERVTTVNQSINQILFIKHLTNAVQSAFQVIEET